MKKSVIQRLLNHESMLKDTALLLETFITANDKTHLYPGCKYNYIGIEIECFAPSRLTVQGLLFASGLEDYVQIGNDDSIEEAYDTEAMELRCLIPEKELDVILPKLGKVLKRAKCKVNESCGLHVHLDMRNRNVEKCYQKLVKFQTIMYGLVGQDRWFNDMCEYSTENNKNERYTAINRLSYSRHKTLEVRLHHGSVDVKEMNNWIRLLLKAIGAKSTKLFENVKSKKDILKWAGPNKKIKSYISRKFDPVWFTENEERNRGVGYVHDEEEEYF